MNGHNVCFLCENEAEKQAFKYDCGHSLCIECFPLTIVSQIKSKGIDSKFFKSENCVFNCLACEKGEVKISNLKEINDSLTRKNITNKQCDGCCSEENVFTCTDCEINLCGACLESRHDLIFKKKPKHNILPVSESVIRFKKNKCSCQNSLKFYIICFNCQEAFCRICSEQHSQHDIKKINEFFVDVIYEFGNYQQFLEKFENFYRNTFDEYDKAVTIGKEVFFKKIDSIIETLNQIKIKYESDCKVDNPEKLTDRMNLIKQSLYKINEIIERKEFPTIPFFLKILGYLNFKEFALEKIEFPQKKFEVLNEVILSISKLSKADFFKDERNLFSEFYMKWITKEDKIKTDFNFKFASDPRECVKNNPEIIKNVDFEDENWKRDKMTIFCKNNQAFLAWGRKNNSAVEIFNLDERKTETVLHGHNNNVKLILCHKNFLITCAENIRVYDIQTNYELKYVIPNNYPNSNVSSSFVFDDVFNIFSPHKNKEFLIFACGYSPIYLCDMENKYNKAYQMNGDKKNCTNLIVYHDKEKKASFLIAAYKAHFLLLMNLEKEEIVYQIKTNGFISATHFEENENEKFLYYTDENSVRMINLSKQQILAQKYPCNDSKIWDMEIWNDDYILVGTYEYFIILNKKNLKPIGNSEQFKNDHVSNLRKFRDCKGREGFIVATYLSNQIRIYRA